jgi:hypothetical protein
MDDVVAETLALLPQSEIEQVEERATATADMLGSKGTAIPGPDLRYAGGDGGYREGDCLLRAMPEAEMVARYAPEIDAAPPTVTGANLTETLRRGPA